MNGGEAGAVGENWIERVDGRIERLDHLAEVGMQPGDIFVISTPGGGRLWLSRNDVISSL